MLLVTWNDAYTELWNQAAQSRGTFTRVGEPLSVIRCSSLAEWPRTTGADVIAIASLVDPILNETPLRPGGYGITRLWQTAVIEIESIAFPNPAAEYVNNRAFWSTLLAVAAHLNAMGTSVPSDDAWDALVETLWSPTTEQRNASEPTARVVAAPTFPGMWSTLRGEFATLRGFDVRADELGGTIEVPRTTYSDALQLARYWSSLLVQLQVKVLTDAVPEPEGFEELQLAWQAAIQRVTLDTIDEPTSVYPENFALWCAARALATVLDVLETRPPPYAVVHQGTTPPSGRSSSPSRNERWPRDGDLSSRLEHLVATALTTVGEVVHTASNRLVATVGRPLLITGATLGVLLLILRATASSSQCESHPEPSRETETG